MNLKQLLQDMSASRYVHCSEEDGELQVILRDTKTEELYDITKSLHINDNQSEKIVFVSRENVKEEENTG